MALFLFTKAILEGRPIDVFNHGNMKRDFTYIDDIVEGVIRVMDRTAAANPAYDAIAADPATSNVRLTAFSISATITRYSCSTSSVPSKTPWAEGGETPACRYRMATCRPPTPTPTCSTTGSASSRVPASKMASAASSPGIAITTNGLRSG
jgi:hypothetical protein